MKRFLSLVVAFIAVFTMNAQTFESSRFIDNTYVRVEGGATALTHPECNKYKNWGHTIQGVIGAEIGKWITPKFGVAFEGDFGIRNGSEAGKFNDEDKAHSFNYINVTGLTKFNVSNIFAGWNPNRKVEFVLATGPMWIHGYPGWGYVNDLGVKFKAEVNYNATERLQLNLIPEFNYNLTGADASDGKHPKFDVCNSWYALKVGVTYKIGKQFTECPYKYTQSDVDALNAEINELREKLEKKPTTVTVVQYVDKAVVETVDNNYTVLFKQGKSDVGDLSDIAKKLNKTDASITIVGSTSPEGSEKFNRNLALARANAVKDALVKAGVDKARITVTNEYGKQRNATIILSK